MPPVVIRGLAELQKNINQIAADLKREIESEALIEAAEKIVVPAIKARAPVKSGRLRDSITVQRAKSRSGKPIVKVGPGKRPFYARFVEFGTSKLKAHPFLRPGVRSVRREVNAFLKAEIGRVIKTRTRGKFKKKKI